MDLMTPLDAETRAQLRLAVHALRSGTRARVFRPRIHLGAPPSEAVAVEADAPDLALRTDIIEELISCAREPVGVWLTRAGIPQPHDLDRAWLAATRMAVNETRLRPPWFVVVTKTGWYRPDTDEQATWQRLRLR